MFLYVVVFFKVRLEGKYVVFLSLREFGKNVKDRPVMSPLARNGRAQRVYQVDGIEKNVQPIDKSCTGSFKRYSWCRKWSWSQQKPNENQWKLMKISENQWKSMQIYEIVLIFTDFGRSRWPLRASRVSYEAPSATFFDWLDIFFDAIDLINTLGTSIPRHG